MEQFLQDLAAITPTTILQWTIALVALVAALVVFEKMQDAPLKRLTDRRKDSDVVVGLIIGAVLGALTGVLWALYNPVKIVPPYIHLRLFSFLIPVIGIVFGRGAGFVAGYVATMVWAPMAGAFAPLHTPIADGIMVGLTGWIPAWLIRGNKNNAELLYEIQSNFRLWWIKSGVILLFTGLFMSFGVALSLGGLGIVPFWVSFWAIGVISDTAPMVFATAPAVYGVLLATRRSWSWMPQF